MKTKKIPEISVVMPCYNEQEGISASIKKAQQSIKKHNLNAEIIISDNGSTDNSVKIAKSLGAKVVSESRKGYGSAYLKGFSSATGKYIIMGDSDDTYDFRKLHHFVKPLRQGYDLVIGSRFKGEILPGAMTWSHQYIGNPILSGLLKIMYHTKISDSHCGMRAFNKTALKKMDLQTTGMEFASEMVVKALQNNLKIFEIPIHYYPRKGETKLVGLRDAWRHLRFLLMYSPNHLFLIPGIFLFLLGSIFLVRLSYGVWYINGHGYDLHSMILASLLTVIGFQIIVTGFYAKVFVISKGFQKNSRLLKTLCKFFNLEKGVFTSLIFIIIGVVLNIDIFLNWAKTGFGQLSALRQAIFASTLLSLGVQGFFASFFFSIMGIPSKK